VSAIPSALTRDEAPPAGDGVWRRIASNYFVRALLKAAITIYIAVTLSFFLIRLMPGSPMEVYINDLISQYGMSYPEARDQASALFSVDLDQPLYVQYLGYMANLARGNLGNSMLSKATPVSSLMVKYLPWTLFSVGTGLMLSFSAGIGLGMLMAYRRESTLDHFLSAVASFSHSIPNYMVGILLLVFLGVQWQLLPIAAMRGSMSPGQQPNLSLVFVLDALFHAALPITTYFLTTVGVWMLTMKSSTVAALGEDYVTVARARGLPDSRITTAYVGRNALLPLFTQFTIAAGFILGGSALIEFVFVYQGIGLTLLSSINQRDYSVMQGVFLTITISVVIANLLADLLYGRLDPRIRLTGGGD
jgi:peptide/nickel transport system permease protein